jgi:hypothetical protein
MLKTIAYDTVNDVSIMVTCRGMVNEYHVRYGLQVTKFAYIGAAMTEFNHCIRHAMKCEGY